MGKFEVEVVAGLALAAIVPFFGRVGCILGRRRDRPAVLFGFNETCFLLFG